MFAFSQNRGSMSSITHKNEHFDINTIKIGSGVESGAAFVKKEVFLAPSYSNTAQPQPL